MRGDSSVSGTGKTLKACLPCSEGAASFLMTDLRDVTYSSFDMKISSAFPLIAISALFAAVSDAHAAWTVTWNPAGSPGSYITPVTYDGTSSGSTRNTTNVVTPSQFSLTGFEDGAWGSRLTLNNVPTAYDLNSYVELPITIELGHAFAPQEIRVATLYGISPSIGTSDYYATFQVRSSVDNYASLLGTSNVDPSSGRNPIVGGGGALGTYDQLVDVSSLGALTGTVTFRLYFQDTNGSVHIRSSIETMPEGMRIIGPDAQAVPEPSASLLGLLGLSIATLYRRRS